MYIQIQVRLVNIGTIALFSKFKLTTGNGKHLKEISHAQLVSLMYKLITSNKVKNDLSIGFNHRRDRRRNKLAQNKNKKGKYQLRIMLKDVLGFAEHQEKATCGLGYKLILTRNKDEAVLDKAAGITVARIELNHIH